jgi:NADH-quinone oxidoreductase subunit G
MPKLTVDGRQVEVPAGTRLIEACKAAGVVVPHFCYHPGLSVAGNCRMCMVEIEMGGRSRVAASCVEPAVDGMTVRTASPEVQDTRQGVMEFLLLNHPIDCPYCDCAGECKLQDYYMDWGAVDTGSRRETEPVHKPKRQEIGPHVMLDSERCVLCTRCVRFTQEVTGTHELGVEERGSHSTLHLAEGKRLDNAYSGNVVDLCPVGALTDRTFRFQRRVWFLQKADSICPGCSRGCNTEIHFDLKRDYKNESSGRRAIRLKPRFNEQVNQWWLCDEGRYGFEAIDQGRLERPLVLRQGVVSATDVEDALSEAARLLDDMARRHPEQLAVLFSPDMSSEALLAARSLFLDQLKIPRADFALSQAPAALDDGFLHTDDPHPNRKGCEQLKLKRGAFADGGLLDEIRQGHVKGLVCFRWDLPALLGAEARELLGKLKLLIVLGTHQQDWHGLANLQVPVAMYAEQSGTFVNVQGKAQRFHAAFPPLGEAMGEVELLVELGQRMGRKAAQTTMEALRRRLESELPNMAGLETPRAPEHRVSKEAAPR